MIAGPETGGGWTDGRRRLRVVVPGFAAFNVYSRIARATTALGPVCIASLADRLPGWEAEVIDENNYRRHGPVDAAGRPDHAALQRRRPAAAAGLYGGLTSTIPRLYELAAFYRGCGVTVIAGGQHFVGANIAEALDHGVDVVVLGEGEETVRELLPALARGEPLEGIAGLAFRRDGRIVETPPRPEISDFARLPRPDFTLVRHARIDLYPVGWTRGCGMNCEFCTVKGRVRGPAPDYVYDQIVSLVERRRAKHFFIVDDLFGQNRPAALELCRRLAAYQLETGARLDLTVQIRLDRARDAELLRAMRAAGINSVAIGFESPVPEELAAMNKKLRPEDMVDYARAFRRAGFFVHGMFIFGYPLPPGVTLDLPARARIRRFRSFVRAARIDTIQVLLPIPLPGTELTARLAAAGRIYPRALIGWEYYDGNFPLFEPDPPFTAEDLQRATRRIMGRFYRFRHFFAVGLHVLCFPAILLDPHSLRAGWQRWHRAWRNRLLRFGGWIILHRWTQQFRRGAFPRKIRAARRAHAH